MKAEDWIKIRNEKGEIKYLPKIDDYVLWHYENGYVVHECIDKDWDDFILNKFLKGYEYTGAITHFQRVVGPYNDR